MRQCRPAQRGFRRGTDEWGAAPVLRECGWSVMEADTSELVTLAEKQARKLGVAQACRVRQHGIEDGLQFSTSSRWRAAPRRSVSAAPAARSTRACLNLLQRLGESLFQLGSGLAGAANARSRLRSG